MATQNLKARSGNRIIVTLDGKQVGLIQNVRMSDDYSPDAASGIGDIHVQEYVPTMARHSLSVEQMVLNQNNMRLAGVTQQNGDGVLQGLVFDFEVYSKDDNTLLRKYKGCSYASGDVSVAKHAIVTASAQFYALDVDDSGQI